MVTIFRNDTWTSFKSEYQLDIESNKSKVEILVQNKVVRRNVYFVRIDQKNNTAFVKASQQYKSSQHLPLVKTFTISRLFLAVIKDDISDSISWNDCLLNKNLEKSDV